MARVENKNEVIEHLWLENEILWRNVRAGVSPSQENVEAVAEVDGIFQARKKWQSGPEDWRLVNEVEQRIGCLLNEDQLSSQFLELYDLASRRKLNSMTVHEANKRSWFDKRMDGATPQQQLSSMRFAYLFLLSELQAHFIEKRFERKLRAGTARTLYKFGFAVLIIGLLPVIAYYVARIYYPDSFVAGLSLRDGTAIGLGLALVFGLLGAFFSRIIRFQSVSAGLHFDDVQAAFVSPMMAIRLLSGLFGALIFYFFIRSGLLGGEAFPDFEKFAGLKPNVDSSAATGLSAAFTEYKELAKLVVWSFAAGFSERLVPDTLVKTEARAVDPGK